MKARDWQISLNVRRRTLRTTRYRLEGLRGSVGFFDCRHNDRVSLRDATFTRLRPGPQYRNVFIFFRSRSLRPPASSMDLTYEHDCNVPYQMRVQGIVHISVACRQSGLLTNAKWTVVRWLVRARCCSRSKDFPRIYSGIYTLYETATALASGLEFPDGDPLQ